MYDLINRYLRVILQHPRLQSDIHKYYWLIQNRSSHAVMQPKFQNKYASYWSIQFLYKKYRKVYFKQLQRAISKPPTLNALLRKLYRTPTNAKGERSIQYSFATKLLHTANNRNPIYSSEVAAFYFFHEPDPSERLSKEEKIDRYVSFYNFLIQEYDRVLQKELLRPSIQKFRKRFPTSQAFTDERIIDLLIWAYVTVLKRDASIDREIRYR